MLIAAQGEINQTCCPSSKQYEGQECQDKTSTLRHLLTKVAQELACYLLLILVLSEGKKTMTQEGQTTCMGSAFLGNGILLLDWDFSSKHPSEKDCSQRKKPCLNLLVPSEAAETWPSHSLHSTVLATALDLLSCNQWVSFCRPFFVETLPEKLCSA